LGFLIDADGNEIIGRRVVSDEYRRDPMLPPDPFVFYLGDVPPCADD